jgi:molybdopterin synthase catalytic subunit
VPVRITDAPFSPQAELDAFMAGRSEAGACVSFVGLVRGSVTALELEHYPGFTEAEIEAFVRRAMMQRNVIDILVVHRVGRMGPGEPIVLAAALSAHRADAFAVVEELMDRLKTDAPFWKREWREGEARWIEPTHEDAARRARYGEES